MVTYIFIPILLEIISFQYHYCHHIEQVMLKYYL